MTYYASNRRRDAAKRAFAYAFLEAVGAQGNRKAPAEIDADYQVALLDLVLGYTRTLRCPPSQG